MTDISAFCFDRESPLVILPDILSFQFHSIQFRSLPFNSVHFVNVLHFILFSNKISKEDRRRYNVIPTEAERERSGVEGSGNWAIYCWK